ncbi:MAG: hypothetical protein EXX96DRAFT_537046 [Benjaminiella poitrasii]|nr:MAG: hypothetical protein EXX96DRAFT_537046 [Benjaminiella poitrasii]
MAHLIIEKQEEWNQQKVRELLRLPENKKCFDCPIKSPFFVNMSVQTFICMRCSGLVREVGHRVKSISASKFSGPEVVALQHGGNEVARSIWLSHYNVANNSEPETDSDVRSFMRQKYHEQKWLDRERAVAHAEKVKNIIKSMFAEDGTRHSKSSINSLKRQSSSCSDRPKITAPTKSWIDDNVPIGLMMQSKNNSSNTGDLLSFHDIPNNN